MALASELSTLGLVPVLLWLHVLGERRQDRQEVKIEEQRKEADARFEGLARGWEKQLTQVIEKYEVRETEIRERYDAVIANYNAERDTLFQQIDRKLDDVIRFIGRT